MKHTTRLRGHGIDLTINKGSFSGLATFVTAPRSVQKAIENAFRELIGDSEGGFGWGSGKQRTRQLAPHVFEVSQVVELCLYKAGPDGVGRRDESSRRAFRVYDRSDWND